MSTPIDYAKHPCFNAKVKGRFGRVHLPVAPKCNIKCNYCDRKYDCVNESRPGVTSTVLSPEQAGVYMEKVLAKEPRITVAGIAGPGDPFANGEETMATMRLIRERFPHMILCLASNGMAIGPYIDELAELNVSHVTITVNAVDPAIGEKIYSWVRDGKVLHRGRAAAELLLARQLAAIEKLTEGKGHHRQDQLHRHPRHQRPSRGRGSPQNEGTRRRSAQLHGPLPQCGHPLRLHSPAGQGNHCRHSAAGGAIPAPDAALHALPGRCGGTLGE